MASLNLDFDALQARVAEQFRGLNPNEPGQWPMLPKVAAWLCAGLAVCAVAWFAVLASTYDEVNAEQAREEELKSTYRGKLAQAINLDELRKQKAQVQEYVTQLERQLPGKAEMDALLSDINQAGLGRGLQFDLFRPGQVVVKDYYAELPISLRVTGRFHDIGAFTADVANLSRIVTLHNMAISVVPANAGGGNSPPPAANGAAGSANAAGAAPTLAMEATARTYRYLDTAELDANRKPKGKTPGATP